MPNPIKILIQSLINPSVYQRTSAWRFRRVLAYVLFWYLIFAICLSAYLTVRFLKPVQTAALNNLNTLKNIYPANLQLSLQANHLTTSGTAEPITLALPIGNLVIDSQNTLASSSAQSILLAKAESVTLNLPALGEPLVIPYSQLNLQGTASAAAVTSALTQFIDDLGKLSPLTVILTLGMGFLLTYLPSRLIYTALVAGLLYFIGAITKTRVTFNYYFKLLLTALVAAESINLTTTILYGRPTPLVFTIAFVGYTFAAVYTATKNNT